MSTRVIQTAFTAGELAPAIYGRIDLAKYNIGLRKAKNVIIHAHGGASNRAGLEFVREVKSSANGARLVPFEFNDDNAYMLEFGHGYFRVFKNGGAVLSGGNPYEVLTTYGSTHVYDLILAQDADVMYSAHGSFAPRRVSRFADDNWTIGDVTFAPKTTSPTGLSASALFARRNGTAHAITYYVTAVSAGGAESAASSGVTIQVMHEFANYDGRHVRLTWNASLGSVLYRVYKDNQGGFQGVIVETAATTIDIPFHVADGDNVAPPVSADPGAPATPTGLAGSTVYGQPIAYVVSAVDADTGEESLPSGEATVVNDLSYSTNRNTLTWSPVANASSYIIYKKDNGAWGYIGSSETTSFVDRNITADLSDGPQTARNPFVGAGNYPRTVGFIEQRLGFGSTINDPQAVFLSQSANYENFGYSVPGKASDAVTFRPKSRKVNEIRAMLGLTRIMHQT